MNNDAQLINEISAMTGEDTPYVIRHYLYVPRKYLAKTLTEALQKLGYTAERRLPAYDSNWLVLARHEAIPTPLYMLSIRRSLEQLVARIGGEYDGWEIDVNCAIDSAWNESMGSDTID